jgi:hypothetical protein
MNSDSIKKILSWLRDKISGSQEEVCVPDSFSMPNLLIPWEAWPGADEDPVPIMARARFGGLISDWVTAIWLPYWDSLSEQDKQKFLSSSTQEWQEWIKRREEDIPFVKEEYAKAGVLFDYRDSLKEIELRYYLLNKAEKKGYDTFPCPSTLKINEVKE